MLVPAAPPQLGTRVAGPPSGQGRKMSTPALPSPARLAGKSILWLRTRGYSEPHARKILKDVVESLARDEKDWEPWATTWWRKLWSEANGTGTNARTSQQAAGKVNNGN